MIARPGLQGQLEEVDTLRAGDLVREQGWDRIDFLKLDIEGYEIGLSKGFANTSTDPMVRSSGTSATSGP